MTRVLALLVLALAVVACGDDDDGSGVAAGDDLVVGVEAPSPLRPGELVWTVSVENRTDDDVTLEFTSGQRADVQLLDGGEPVYTWSAARSFIQALGEETVPAGERIEFELEDTLDVGPGEYELEATITAANHGLSVTRTVTVEPRSR